MNGNHSCRDCQVMTTDNCRRVRFYSKSGYLYSLCEACDSNRTAKAYEETGILTSRLWMELTLKHRDQWDNPTMPFLVSMAKVKMMAARFGRMIWFGGLQDFFRKSDHAAFSMGDDTGFKILMLASAGRAMFTFNNPNGQSVTLITDESSDTAVMGVQGIEATEETALSLIARGTALWGSGVRPEVDREVGFGLW